MKRILFLIGLGLTCLIGTPQKSNAQIQSTLSTDSANYHYWCGDSTGSVRACDSAWWYLTRFSMPNGAHVFVDSGRTTSPTQVFGGAFPRYRIPDAQFTSLTAGRYELAIVAWGGTFGSQKLTTPRIIDFSVGLDSSSIISQSLADNVVSAPKIATDAITAAKIAASAITSSEAPNLDAAVSSRLAPTTAGRTLDVTATGEAGLDFDNTAGTLGQADYSPDYLSPTVDGRTLNVASTGQAGINWGDVTNQTATVGLNNTTIGTLINGVTVSTGGITSGSFAAGAIDAGAIAADAITASELGATAAGEITDSVWRRTRVAGNIPSTSFGAALDSLHDVDSALWRANIVDQKIDVNIDGDIQEVNAIGAGGITATTFASGAIGADAIATDAIGSPELAASAAQEIASNVADSVWMSLFGARDDVAGSFGDSAQGWGQTGAGGTGLDSATTSRIIRRILGGGNVSLNGSDSLTTAQKVVTAALQSLGVGPYTATVYFLDSASGAAVQGYNVSYRDSITQTTYTQAMQSDANGKVQANVIGSTTYYVRGSKQLYRFAANADTVLNMASANFTDTVLVVGGAVPALGVSGTVTVYAYEVGPDGVGIPGAKVTARLSTTATGGLIQFAGTDSAKWMNNIPKITFTSAHADSLGLWRLPLLPPASLQDTCANYTITVEGNAGGQQIRKTYRCVRPPDCIGQAWIVREEDPCPECD